MRCADRTSIPDCHVVAGDSARIRHIGDGVAGLDGCQSGAHAIAVADIRINFGEYNGCQCRSLALCHAFVAQIFAILHIMHPHTNDTNVCCTFPYLTPTVRNCVFDTAAPRACIQCFQFHGQCRWCWPSSCPLYTLVYESPFWPPISTASRSSLLKP